MRKGASTHSELVKAGMELARQQGKHIGRPRVTERTNFLQRFSVTVDHIELGLLSKRQAAKDLAIGYATLKRLLDARPVSPECQPAAVENG